jgi:hypothetical protein
MSWPCVWRKVVLFAALESIGKAASPAARAQMNLKSQIILRTVLSRKPKRVLRRVEHLSSIRKQYDATLRGASLLRGMWDNDFKDSSTFGFRATTVAHKNHRGSDSKNLDAEARFWRLTGVARILLSLLQEIIWPAEK